MDAKRLNHIISHCFNYGITVTHIYLPEDTIIRGKHYAGNKWYIATDVRGVETIYPKPVADGPSIDSRKDKEAFEAIEKTYEFLYKKYIENGNH